MVAATSWRERLKAGLARTREVLTADLGELFTRRKIDEALFEQLETALLTADCGVEATQSLMTELRARVRRDKLEDGEALKSSLKKLLVERLAPLERALSLAPVAGGPRVLLIAGVNGSGKT